VEAMPSRISMIVVVLLFLLPACSDTEGLGEISYEEQIQGNIFNISCLIGCHDGTRRGGVELSSWSTLMEGGDNGDVIIPFNAEESRLVVSVEGGSNVGIPVEPMPPAGRSQLNLSEIRIIKDWIDQGAKDN